MQNEQRIEFLETELARLLNWIQSSENRLSLIIPLTTAMLSGLFILAPSYDSWTILQGVLIVLSALLLLITIVCAVISSFPRTDGPKGSLIYFGGISALERQQYLNAISKLTIDDFIKDLSAQCYVNALIASKKFAWVQRSLGFMFAATIPWLIAITDLYR